MMLRKSRQQVETEKKEKMKKGANVCPTNYIIIISEEGSDISPVCRQASYSLAVILRSREIFLFLRWCLARNPCDCIVASHSFLNKLRGGSKINPQF